MAMNSQAELAQVAAALKRNQSTLRAHCSELLAERNHLRQRVHSLSLRIAELNATIDEQQINIDQLEDIMTDSQGTLMLQERLQSPRETSSIASSSGGHLRGLSDDGQQQQQLNANTSNVIMTGGSATDSSTTPVTTTSNPDLNLQADNDSYGPVPDLYVNPTMGLQNMHSERLLALKDELLSPQRNQTPAGGFETFTFSVGRQQSQMDNMVNEFNLSAPGQLLSGVSRDNHNGLAQVNANPAKARKRKNTAAKRGVRADPHTYLPRVSKEEGSKQCPHCSYVSRQTGNLRRHIFMVHAHVRNNACTMCDMKFLYAYQLEQHKKVRHFRQRLYKCPVCTYTSLDTAKLQKHIDKRHSTNAAETVIVE